MQDPDPEPMHPVNRKPQTKLAVLLGVGVVAVIVVIALMNVRGTDDRNDTPAVIVAPAPAAGVPAPPPEGTTGRQVR